MSDFTEFHDELRSVARSLLADSAPGNHHGCPSQPLDVKTLAEVGWLGLEVPTVLGGAGCTPAESMIVLEELGRVASTADPMSAATQAVGALNLTRPNERRDALLSQIGVGDTTATLVLWADHDNPDQSSNAFALRETLANQDNSRSSALLLSGSAEFVLDAVSSEILLLAAHDSDHNPCLVAIGRATPGIRIESVPTIDETRYAVRVIAHDVLVTSSDILHFGDNPKLASQHLADRAALGIAVDSLGISEAMLDATVSYVQERHQFGRPIGSFQAVKHTCANMMVSASVSRELCTAALESLRTDFVPGLNSVEVSMAKSYVCDAAVEVAGAAIQLHGGIGYSWESGIHVYQKRALFNRSLAGTPALHRQQIARRYLHEEWTNQ